MKRCEKLLHNQHHLSQNLVKSHSPVEGIFSGIKRIKDAKIPRQSCCNLIVTCTPKNYPMIALVPSWKRSSKNSIFILVSAKTDLQSACVYQCLLNLTAAEGLGSGCTRCAVLSRYNLSLCDFETLKVQTTDFNRTSVAITFFIFPERVFTPLSEVDGSTPPGMQRVKKW